MKKVFLLVVLGILIGSCSSLEHERKHERFPASGENTVEHPKEEVLRLFQIQSSQIKYDHDLSKTLEMYVGKSFSVGTNGPPGKIQIEFLLNENLPQGISYVPQFHADKIQYKILILHSKDALNDPVATAELFNFLMTISDGTIFMSEFDPYEMYYNALKLDPISAYNWAKIRELAATDIPGSEFNDEEVINEIKKRRESWAKDVEDFREVALKAIKNQKKKEEERRAVIEALDMAGQDLQFKTLVAKNDRKGTAELLKKYLPWAQMPPFEKRYWETYLDVMVNPVPINERVLIYRGLEDDVIYPVIEAGEELEKETAKKEGKIFVMSSLITKNQGTWNRRLRSLTTMYDKYIASNYDLNNEFTQSFRIMTMFGNHADRPDGSPFLSLTPNFNTAYKFGKKRMGAFALDPRLISFNLASPFKDELEFILPLVTFPDDLAGYYDSNIHSGIVNDEKRMISLFKSKLISAHGSHQGEKIFDEVMLKTKKFFASSFTRYDKKEKATNLGLKNGLIANFFNDIYSDKEEKISAHPIKIRPVKESTCTDIISRFWN